MQLHNLELKRIEISTVVCFQNLLSNFNNLVLGKGGFEPPLQHYLLSKIRYLQALNLEFFRFFPLTLPFFKIHITRSNMNSGMIQDNGTQS